MTTKQAWQRVYEALRAAQIPKSRQRGAADLVSVAVGMVILSIAVAGTAGAMIYGRDTLIRQEHYKTAAFFVRGVLEEEIGRIQMRSDARRPEENPGALEARRNYRTFNLDYAGDRMGRSEPVVLLISRDEIRRVDLPETGDGWDYYVVTVRGRWTERDMAGHVGIDRRQVREIVLTTSVVVRDEI